MFQRLLPRTRVTSTGLISLDILENDRFKVIQLIWNCALCYRTMLSYLQKCLSFWGVSGLATTLKRIILSLEIYRFVVAISSYFEFKKFHVTKVKPLSALLQCPRPPNLAWWWLTSRGPPTRIITWSFSHVVSWDHETN